MSVNKVILLGNLGKDPEVKYLDANRVVANFTLATNESYTNKEGVRVKQTEWHDLELWDGLAKTAEKYLKKGNQIYVEGKIKTDRWTDKEGNNRQTKRIRVNTFTMLGSPNAEKPAAPAAKPVAETPPPKTESAKNQDSLNDDDLPF